MKFTVLFASGAALALCACQSEEPAAEATDTAAAEATEAAAAPAAPAAVSADAFTAGQPPSTEFMVGTWGEGTDCELAINFQADGTIKDGPFDKWVITDGVLVMDDLAKISLKVIDKDSMESLSEGSDEPRTLTRCA